MKNIPIYAFLCVSSLSFSQSKSEIIAGQKIKIEYPSNYFQTFDLNDNAMLQLANAVQSKYAIIIQDEKASLDFFKIKFLNLEEAVDFYSKTLYAGLENNDKKKKSKAIYKEINGYKAVEVSMEGQLKDEESQELMMLYYMFTVIETPKFIYQILSWSDSDNKALLEKEFREIAESFKEVN